MTRKDKANVRDMGGTYRNTIEPYFDGPQLAEVRTNVSLLERAILQILRSEIARLKDDEAELTRFFSHFFDPMAGTEERGRFVTNFMREPPEVLLGYPRETAVFPCFAVILEISNSLKICIWSLQENMLRNLFLRGILQISISSAEFDLMDNKRTSGSFRAVKG